MNDETRIPAQRDLSPGRLQLRKEHLVREVSMWDRAARRRRRRLVVVLVPAIIAVLAVKFWPPLCEALALDLKGDERMATNAGRLRFAGEVEAALIAGLGALTLDQADRRLGTAGVPHAPVLGILDALATPYVQGRGVVVSVYTPEGTYRMVRGPLSAGMPTRPAPALGEHTEEVLRDVRGRGYRSLAAGVENEVRAMRGVADGTALALHVQPLCVRRVGPLRHRGPRHHCSGDRAGGDKRGRQSAAIYVVKPKGGYGGHLDRWLDYRVDDHEDPVPRLGELLEMHDLYFGKSAENERVEIKNSVLQQVTEILRRTGYLENGKDFVVAFNAFIGNENFEERADPQARWIDGPVLEYLLKRFSK